MGTPYHPLSTLWKMQGSISILFSILSIQSWVRSTSQRRTCPMNFLETKKCGYSGTSNPSYHHFSVKLQLHWLSNRCFKVTICDLNPPMDPPQAEQKKNTSKNGWWRLSVTSDRSVPEEMHREVVFFGWDLIWISALPQEPADNFTSGY